MAKNQPWFALLYHLSQTINSSLDLEEVLDRVMLVAGNTKFDDFRPSYLENAPENRKILKEAKARGIVLE